MNGIFVNGLVGSRDHKPKIQLSDENGKILSQMDAEDAVHLAFDIIKMAEATKVDAAIWTWVQTMHEKDPEAAIRMGASLMMSFRDFRADLEEESRARQRGDLKE
jgi:hypothetical protein